MSKKHEFLKVLIQISPVPFHLSSWFVLAGITGSFFIGVYLTDLSNKFSTREEEQKSQIPIGMLFAAATPTAFGFVKFIDSMISKEEEISLESKINKVMTKQKKEQDKEVKEQVDSYKARFKGDFERLENLIKKEKLPSKTLREAGAIFSRLEHIFEEHKLWLEEAYKISNWLDKTVDDLPYAHRYELVNVAKESIQDLMTTRKEKDYVLKMFDHDMKECIHWLHDSLANGVPCVFEQDRYASALVRNLLESKLYVVALDDMRTYIQKDKTLGDSHYKDDAINELFDHLIEKIKTISHSQTMFQTG